MPGSDRQGESISESETYREWVYDNRNCKIQIVRNVQGYYCGYVQTALDGDYDEISRELTVPMELTYGVDEEGWIGFDCAHAWDRCLDENGIPLEGRDDMETPPLFDVERREWRPEDVETAVELLADQIKYLEQQAGANVE